MKNEEYAETYLNGPCAVNKASTRRTDRSLFDRHVLPLLGDERMRQVTIQDVVSARNAIRDGKTARREKTKKHGMAVVRGGPGIANRVLDKLSAMFNYALKNEIVDRNPAAEVERFKSAFLPHDMSIDEIRRLGEVLRQAEREGQNPVPVAALRFLFLSGFRKTSALALRWEDIRWDDGTITLQDSKTGPKKLKVGRRPLRYLKALPWREESGWVFPGRKEGAHFVGLQKFWESLRSRCGLGHVRIHDQRHTFASVSIGAGHSLYAVGQLLGHASLRATARYAHFHGGPLAGV